MMSSSNEFMEMPANQRMLAIYDICIRGVRDNLAQAGFTSSQTRHARTMTDEEDIEEDAKTPAKQLIDERTEKTDTDLKGLLLDYSGSSGMNVRAASPDHHEHRRRPCREHGED